MARRRSRGSTVELSRTVTVGEDEVDVTITADITPGEPDHYDRSIGGPGGWSPGSGPEINDIEIVAEDGTVVDYDALPPKERNWIADLLIEAACEQEADARSARDDDAYDRWRDRQWEREAD